MEIYRYAVVEGDIILFVPGRTSSIKITILKITKKVVTNGVVTRLPIGEIIFKASPMVY